jgi:cytochrome c-type biogenesis protein CcmF
VIIFSVLLLITKDKLFRNLAIICTLIVVFSITGAYLLLSHYFYISNFDIHYVWYNSGENMEWYLKLTGVWAGQEGSFLVWVWLILIAVGIEEGIQFYRRRKESKYLSDLDEIDDEDEMDEEDQLSTQKTHQITAYDWARIIVMLVILVFLILLILHDPFEPTHPHVFNEGTKDEFTIYPENYPAGHGMNPMLRNLWMVIHPPLLFIGYAWITIPFASGLSYSITGDRKWTKTSILWSRLAWLFLTLGIGIGAIWAYIALGWGGYWAWDPVEVGSLIPWVTLSAFLHTQLMNKRKNEYGIITPLLGALTFVLVIFATYITRSGVWQSVHAWSETEVGLILKWTIYLTLAFTIIIISLSYYFGKVTPRPQPPRQQAADPYGPPSPPPGALPPPPWARSSWEPPEDEAPAAERHFKRILRKNWDSISMFLTTILFFILTLVIFVALWITKGKVIPELYETRLTPIIILLLVVMSICLCWRYFGKENSIYIIAWTALAGVACAVVLPKYVFPDTATDFYGNFINTHHIVGFIIPFVFLLIIVAFVRMIKTFNRKSARTTLNSIGAQIIHIGVVLIILGYVASQTMLENSTEQLREGETMDFDEYQIKLIDIKITEDTGDKDSNENWDTWDVTVDIYKNKILKERVKMNVVYGFNFDQQGRRYYSMIMSSEIYVEEMLKEDLYISFKAVNNDVVEIEAQTIPLVSYLWIGMILFIIGITIRIIVDSIPRKRKRYEPETDIEPTRGRLPPSEISERPRRGIKSAEKEIDRKTKAGKPKGRKSKKDYEKMLEDELKRLKS